VVGRNRKKRVRQVKNQNFDIERMEGLKPALADLGGCCIVLPPITHGTREGGQCTILCRSQEQGFH
jgi:hypothetical protein